MLKKILARASAFGVSLLLMPSMAIAAAPVVVPNTGNNPNLTRVSSLLQQVYNILNDIVLPGILVLALIFFMWGVAMFILGAGDEEKREQGKHVMTWGIVALFVIVAVWGIVFWIASLLDIGIGGSAPNPGVIRQ